MEQVPHDSALEQHIIGCMIYDPDCIGEAIEVLKPAFFYHQENQMLCEKILGLWNDDPLSVSMMSLVPFFEKHHITINQMSRVIESIATTKDIRFQALRLKEIAALRFAVDVGRSLIGMASLKDANEIKDAITKAESRLSRISDATVQTDTMMSMKTLAQLYSEDVEKRAERPSAITGVKSGMPDLDRFTAGFQKSDLIILAARPSVGKTAFMNQLSMYMESPAEESGLVFSLEMSKVQLIERMTSNKSGINSGTLKSGSLRGDDEWIRFANAVSELSEKKLVIDDQAGITIPEIKAKARKVRKERGLAFIMIDYLGLIRGGRGMNRYELVSENVRQLKEVAKEFNVPVICLSQLSRKADERGDKKPVLSDLRESGEIEQTADVVLFLHRDDYYNTESEKKNIIEIIIAKNRNGPVGEFEMVYLKETSRFLRMEGRR